MFLGRVMGNVWSTRKEESLRGLKFLIIQPLTITFKEHLEMELSECGNTIIAADRIGAGETEIVMIVSGSSARQSLEDSTIPVDAIVAGIIDKETFER